jgi:hypothetical protein
LKASRHRERQIHRGRFEAQSGCDVRTGGEFRWRGLFRKDDSRLDEINGTIAVAILENGAWLEEIGKREGSGLGVGARLLASTIQLAESRKSAGKKD